MQRPCSAALGAMHRRQVRREPWPEFDAFDPAPYAPELLREARDNWAERARAEHGSVHQFSQLSLAFAVARAPLELQGAVARLITDEVRHAELCAGMAAACAPGESLEWPTPRAPWQDPPLAGPTPELLAWAARAVLVACCLGETISRPLLEGVVVVATDPLPEAIARQILRDEQLHATFGWEALAWLLPRLEPDARARLEQHDLPRALAGFEATTACGFRAADLAGTTLRLRRGPPNLGVLSPREQAQIFFAALEGEVFAKLRGLGFDPLAAWRARGA
ncbi:MAG: hypothetical protein R3F62_09340 [Planctomycetota bacterium]